MSLRGLLRQSVIIKNPTGTSDRHGKDTLGSATTVRARFERKYKIIYSADKEKTPIHGICIVNPDTDVEIGAQLEFDGQKYRVLERNDATGRKGDVHHYELMCQYWSF